AAKPSTISPIQQTNAYAQIVGKLIDATCSNASSHFIILIKSGKQHSPEPCTLVLNSKLLRLLRKSTSIKIGNYTYMMNGLIQTSGIKRQNLNLPGITSRHESTEYNLTPRSSRYLTNITETAIIY